MTFAARLLSLKSAQGNEARKARAWARAATSAAGMPAWMKAMPREKRARSISEPRRGVGAGGLRKKGRKDGRAQVRSCAKGQKRRAGTSPDQGDESRILTRQLLAQLPGRASPPLHRPDSLQAAGTQQPRRVHLAAGLGMAAAAAARRAATVPRRRSSTAWAAGGSLGSRPAARRSICRCLRAW